jgi:hypothetical protein
MTNVVVNDDNYKLPRLFYSLDHEDRISSKWLAKETDKQHKHVLRDINNALKKLNGPNLDHSITVINSTGYHNREKEYLLSLELATIVLSHYQGKKSEQAFNLVYEALHYYRNKAPLLEKENLDLKSQVQILKSQSQKKIEKEKKSTYLLPIFDTDIFGNEYVCRFELKEKKELSVDELKISKIFHNNKIISGLQKKTLDLLTSLVGNQNLIMNSIAKLILKEGQNPEC